MQYQLNLLYYPQQGSNGTQGSLHHYRPRQGFFNNNNQQRTNRNFTPPASNAFPPVPSGLVNTPPQKAQSSNPSNS